MLHDRNQPIRDAAELGHLAEQLGRPFEAESTSQLPPRRASVVKRRNAIYLG